MRWCRSVPRFRSAPSAARASRLVSPEVQNAQVLARIRLTDASADLRQNQRAFRCGAAEEKPDVTLVERGSGLERDPPLPGSSTAMWASVSRFSWKFELGQEGRKEGLRGRRWLEARTGKVIPGRHR